VRADAVSGGLVEALGGRLRVVAQITNSAISSTPPRPCTPNRRLTDSARIVGPADGDVDMIRTAP
jgi:hypothetical protein